MAELLTPNVAIHQSRRHEVVIWLGASCGLVMASVSR